ncbi:MAG: DUF4163 domain-containing protein [Pseudomonadota bacterium]
MKHGVWVWAVFALSACAASPDLGTGSVLAAQDKSEDVSAIEEFKETDKDGSAERDFGYSWPGQIAGLPALVSRMEQDRDEARMAQEKEWKEAIAEFGAEGCFSCTSRSFERNWRVIADTKRYVSLASNTYIYGGGAHGNSYSGSLVWDKKTDEHVKLTDLFTSSQDLQNAMWPRFCKVLNEQRAEKRGAPISPDSTDSFETCPDIDSITVQLASSDGQSIDQINLIADPYVAGPYVEGPYEVTLGVDRQVFGVLKPEALIHFQFGR